MRNMFILFIFMLLFFKCNNSVNSNKPKNIPDSVIWIGGSDGGGWVAFETVTDSSILATIYYENGNIWEKGEFVQSIDCGVLKENVIASINGFDGKNLLTNNLCKYIKK